MDDPTMMGLYDYGDYGDYGDEYDDEYDDEYGNDYGYEMDDLDTVLGQDGDDEYQQFADDTQYWGRYIDEDYMLPMNEMADQPATVGQ